jgi:hypothetical protein
MQAIEHDAEIESVRTKADEKAANQIGNTNKKETHGVSAHCTKFSSAPHGET